MKRVWLTAFDKDEQKVQGLMKRLKTYGLDVDGHFWEDDLEKMAWVGPRDELISDHTAAWLLYVKGNSLDKPSIRYGLSMLTLTVQAQRGHGFPIIALLDGAGLTAGDLPTPLKAIDLLKVDDPSAFAKVVATVHRPPAPALSIGYRIDAYGNSQIGQWFEIGPSDASWNGAMFGISESSIMFHAVGHKGSLPERAVLNYPIKDMKIEMSGMEFTAWAVQNELSKDDSYFVKVEGWPAVIIFGQFAQEDEAEVYTIRLK